MSIEKERPVVVEFDPRRNVINLFHEKSVLCGETIDVAMEDPKMEAIFANTEVENYLECIIRLVFEKNEEIDKLKHALRDFKPPLPSQIELATENAELMKMNLSNKRRIEELERELKHIATQAGRAVHK